MESKYFGEYLKRQINTFFDRKRQYKCIICANDSFYVYQVSH